MLCALARDAIELAARHCDLPARGTARERRVIERVERLHRALAIGALADNQAAAVVLDCGGEDLRRRGAETIHQHRQRTGIHHPGFGIVEYVSRSIRFTDLYDWATVHEQARERSGFRQVAAAIAPQVEHEAVDTALCKLADEALHIACRTLVVGVAPVLGRCVEIETRYRDHADAHFVAIALDGVHR